MRLIWMVGLGVIIAASCGNAVAADKVLVNWRFEQDGDLLGWQPNGHLADVAVRDGCLQGRATDHDPILIGPVFEIEAGPTQYIEIELRATEDSDSELFWTETLSGRYGGFSGEKVEKLSVRGDGRFRVYRLWPFWQAARKIIRLRYDPPHRGQFELAAIRVLEAGTELTHAQSWRFDKSPQGWRAWRNAAEPVAMNGALEMRGQDDGPPVIMSPLLSIDAGANPFACIRMAVSGGNAGHVILAASSTAGSETMNFQLRPDGRMHTYNIDVGSLAGWQGTIMVMGLRPTDAPDAIVRIESIHVGPEPWGEPAEPDIRYFGCTEAVCRTERPVRITCALRNFGGKPATRLRAGLHAAAGVSIIGAVTQTVESLSLYLGKTVTWQVVCRQPGPVALAVTVESDGTRAVSATTTVTFTRTPDVTRAAYVPEPQPVKCRYDVGAYYFPGWHSMARWRPVLDYPERKPALGWYDEANPECTDWQIKWAVEHGINLFMVDWYWCGGARHHDQWRTMATCTRGIASTSGGA